MPSVLWHCWLGVRKSIRPAKIEWWDVVVVICLERGADCLHMAHLMPLHPLTLSSLASFKSRLVIPCWYRLTQVVLLKRPLNGCSSSSSSQGEVMPCGWKGNRRSGVALAMRHRLQWLIHLWDHGLRKGDDHHVYTTHGRWHTDLFYWLV